MKTTAILALSAAFMMSCGAPATPPSSSSPPPSSSSGGSVTSVDWRIVVQAIGAAVEASRPAVDAAIQDERRRLQVDAAYAAVPDGVRAITADNLCDALPPIDGVVTTLAEHLTAITGTTQAELVVENTVADGLHGAIRIISIVNNCHDFAAAVARRQQHHGRQ